MVFPFGVPRDLIALALRRILRVVPFLDNPNPGEPVDVTPVMSPALSSTKEGGQKIPF
jgi:hypothetical protein